MTTEQTQELLPCRACGKPCRIEMFDGPMLKATLWLCSSNRTFGGDGCSDKNAYLSAEAWNDRRPELNPSGWHLPSVNHGLALAAETNGQIATTEINGLKDALAQAEGEIARLTPINGELIERLRGLAAKATPGPWDTDAEHNDGAYGSGPDCASGFESSMILASDGHSLFDALNSTAIVVYEDVSDEHGYVAAWDETSRANAALIVALVNNLPTILEALSRPTYAEGVEAGDA